jgi:hypothetical protein
MSGKETEKVLAFDLLGLPPVIEGKPGLVTNVP